MLKRLTSLILLTLIVTAPAHALKPDVDRALNQAEHTATLYLSVMDDYLKRIEPRLPDRTKPVLQTIRDDRSDYMSALRSALRRTRKLKRPDYDQGVEQVEAVTTHYMNRMRDHLSRLMKLKAADHHREEGKTYEQRLLRAYKPPKSAMDKARAHPDQAERRLDNLRAAVETYSDNVAGIFDDLGTLNETTEEEIWAFNDRVLSRLDDRREDLASYRSMIGDVRSMAQSHHDRFLQDVTMDAYAGTTVIEDEPWNKLMMMNRIPRRIETGVQQWTRSILPLDPLQRSKRRGSIARSRAQLIFTDLLQDRRHGRIIRADVEVYHRAYREAFRLSTDSYTFYSDQEVPGYLTSELKAIKTHRDHLQTMSDFQLPGSARTFMKKLGALEKQYRAEIKQSEYTVKY